jgi:hypothetical protein
MNFISTYLKFWAKFRLKQIGRMLVEIGVVMLIALALILTLFVLTFNKYMSASPSVFWAFLPAFPAISAHFQRKDRPFFKQLECDIHWIFALEYLMMAIPFLLIMAFSQNILTLVLGALLSVLCVFLPQKKDFSSKKTYNFSFIPLSMFEWRMGFRKNNFVFIAIYLLAILASSFEGTIFLFTFFFVMSIAEFYEHNEPKEWFGQDFSLGKKIALHLSAWTVIFLPIAIIFWILFPHLYWLPFFAWLLGALSILYLLAYKYANWSPFKRKTLLGSIGMFNILMIFMVLTAIIPISATIYFLIKAKNNKFIKC